MTSRFMLFVDSSTAVTLYPEWDVKRRLKKIENRHRTRSGKEYRYLHGNYDGWEFGLKDVSSSDACVINSWWGANTQLLFTNDSGSSVMSCMLANTNTPLDAYDKPYDDLYKGKIDLETY